MSAKLRRRKSAVVPRSLPFQNQARIASGASMPISSRTSSSSTERSSRVRRAPRDKGPWQGSEGIRREECRPWHPPRAHVAVLRAEPFRKREYGYEEHEECGTSAGEPGPWPR